MKQELRSFPLLTAAPTVPNMSSHLHRHTHISKISLTLSHKKLFIERWGRVWCISSRVFRLTEAENLWCIAPEWGFRAGLELHRAQGVRGDSSSALMQYSNPAWCCSVPHCCKAVLSHHRPRWVTLPTPPLPPQPLDILCTVRGLRGWTHMQEHGQTHTRAYIRQSEHTPNACIRMHTNTGAHMLQAEHFNCNNTNECEHTSPVWPTCTIKV